MATLKQRIERLEGRRDSRFGCRRSQRRLQIFEGVFLETVEIGSGDAVLIVPVHVDGEVWARMAQDYFANVPWR